MTFQHRALPRGARHGVAKRIPEPRLVNNKTHDKTHMKIEENTQEISQENLINAAPEMLQALQAITDAFMHRDSIIIKQCKAALAKAKGEA